MKTYFVSVIFLLLFAGCNNDPVTSGTDLIFDESEALIESNWTIQKITTKFGTHNPYEVVPPSEMNEINSGNSLVGEIKFNSDNSIYIHNASDEFHFNRLNGMQWNYENRFIRFTHEYGGFGYKVIWYGKTQMQWYVEFTGISSGLKSVEIITLQAIQYNY